MTFVMLGGCHNILCNDLLYEYIIILLINRTQMSNISIICNNQLLSSSIYTFIEKYHTSHKLPINIGIYNVDGTHYLIKCDYDIEETKLTDSEMISHIFDNLTYIDSNIANLFNLSYISGDIKLTDSVLLKFPSIYVDDLELTFNKCEFLETLDLSNVDTSKAISFSGAFQKCTKLKTLKQNFDTTNVKDMSYMFNVCSSLTDIGDISDWNTSNVTNMMAMFNSCSSLTTIGDLSKWDVSNVTNMYYMFANCSAVQTINGLSKWDISNVTNMGLIFGMCKSLEGIGDLSKWDVSNVTNMYAMFGQCFILKEIGDLSKWDVSNVTDMSYMFMYCTSLTSIGDLSNGMLQI